LRLCGNIRLNEKALFSQRRKDAKGRHKPNFSDSL
jgi:hypothetical protein